ncbi:CRISPR-associated endonuclease Cas1 [bacterium]|nr:CRISPR-associated endonuclease Cas1 [bacterium]
MSEAEQLPKPEPEKKPEQRSESITSGPEQSPDQGILLIESEEHAQLYVEGYGLFLGKHSERILVKKGKEILAEVPFFRIQEICIASRGVTLSSDLMEAACHRGIRIVFLSSSEPYAMITSPYLSATVAIRRSQLEAMSNGKAAEWAKAIVRAKIANQRQILYYFGKYIREARPEDYPELEKSMSQLRALIPKVKSSPVSSLEEARSTIMGLEGTAGRIYWSGIQKILRDEFCGREHQGATNPVNAMLNYGYGILYGICWGALLNAGLEPFAGFLHVDRPGKPSLVLDFVEEFRQPLVDRVVVAHFNLRESCRMKDGMLDLETRKLLVQKIYRRLSANEKYRGKEYQTRSIIQMQARRLSRFIRDETNYRPYRFRL